MREQRSRWPMLVAGLAIGLVLGGGATALVLLLSGEDSGAAGIGADADADIACALLERTSPELDPENDFAGYQRWGAAVNLAAAAAEEDPRYQPLADAVRLPLNIFQQKFSSENPEFAEAAAKARMACAAR